MEYLLWLFVFVFGNIIGSFLNVVILRHNTGRGLEGRSQCFSCGKKLHWYELVPLWSWVVQRGRCRGCKSSISSQYPLVELSVGLLFLFSYLTWGATWLAVVSGLVWSILTIIFVYDLRHKIIPDAWSVWLFFSALLFVLVENGFDFGPSLGHRISAGILLGLPFAFLWLVSRGRWLGLGDAKLAVGLGVWLGLCRGIDAIALAFIVGAVVGVIILTAEKIVKKKQVREHSWLARLAAVGHEVPFAPFMILGAGLIFFGFSAYPHYCRMWQDFLSLL